MRSGFRMNGTGGVTKQSMNADAALLTADAEHVAPGLESRRHHHLVGDQRVVRIASLRG